MTAPSDMSAGDIRRHVEATLPWREASDGAAAIAAATAVARGAPADTVDRLAFARRIVVAGAPPPTRTIERVETDLGWEFIQIYGLTETSPLLTMNRGRAEWDALDSGERARKLSRAGAPALGVRLRLEDDGEILARGNHVLAGYWEQPEATAETLRDGWLLRSTRRGE